MQSETQAAPRGLRFKERWEVVQEEIRRRILAGEIRPGTPIKEVEVAQTLGVSRGTVREAIRALEISGLVSRRPQRTSIVTPITRREVDELYSMRAIMEDLAISRSIELNRASLKRDLESRLADLTDAFRRKADPTTLADLDVNLHSAFYESADHDRLEAAWATISDALKLMMTYTNSQLDYTERTDAVHHELVAAAVAGDVERARELAAQHLREAHARILAFVD